MGWHGPRGGYKNIREAIADNLEPAAVHVVGPGLAWALLEPSSTTHGGWLIACVLLERGMVKLMATSEGPYYTGCPLDWYDKVEVFTEYGYDREWRERNRAAAEAREQVGAFVPAGGVSADD